MLPRPTDVRHATASAIGAHVWTRDQALPGTPRERLVVFQQHTETMVAPLAQSGKESENAGHRATRNVVARLASYAVIELEKP